MDFLQILSATDNLTAAIVALALILGFFRSRYKKTIGQRKQSLIDLYSIGPGGTSYYVESLFGPAVYIADRTVQITTVGDDLTKVETHLYSARHGWLTVHYSDKKIIAFAFMITDPKFDLDISAFMPIEYTRNLGRSTFFDVESDCPGSFQRSIGNHNWSYEEVHFYGRIGLYKHFGLAQTMHGWSKQTSDSHAANEDVAQGQYLKEGGITSPAASPSWLKQFRKTNYPDTISVFDSSIDFAKLPGTCGAVDQDDLRSVRARGPQGWKNEADWTLTERRRQAFWHRLLSRVRFY